MSNRRKLRPHELAKLAEWTRAESLIRQAQSARTDLTRRPAPADLPGGPIRLGRRSEPVTWRRLASATEAGTSAGRHYTPPAAVNGPDPADVWLGEEDIRRFARELDRLDADDQLPVE